MAQSKSVTGRRDSTPPTKPTAPLTDLQALEILDTRDLWAMDELPNGIDADILRALDDRGAIKVRAVRMKNLSKRAGDPAPTTPDPGEWCSPIRNELIAGTWDALLAQKTRNKWKHPPEIKLTDKGKARLARLRQEAATAKTLYVVSGENLKHVITDRRGNVLRDRTGAILLDRGGKNGPGDGSPGTKPSEVSKPSNEHLDPVYDDPELARLIEEDAFKPAAWFCKWTTFDSVRLRAAAMPKRKGKTVRVKGDRRTRTYSVRDAWRNWSHDFKSPKQRDSA